MLIKMKFVKGIKIFITANLLLISLGAGAVTLPGTSYNPTSFDEDVYGSTTIVGTGIRLPASSFIALGVTDCSAYSTDKEGCDTCCEGSYTSCTEDCSEEDTDCWQACADAVSTCKKAYCPTSVPIDGGMWVLAVLVSVLAIIRTVRSNKLYTI